MRITAPIWNSPWTDSIVSTERPGESFREILCLKVGKTKKGNPKYNFSPKEGGDEPDKIPEGFEIYENPARGLVYLRKKQPNLITDAEESFIRKHLKKMKLYYIYMTDIKGGVLTVFESVVPVKLSVEETIRGFKLSFDEKQKKEYAKKVAAHDRYCPVLRFLLIDSEKRMFSCEEFEWDSFEGEWENSGGPAPLEKLVPVIMREYEKERKDDFSQ